MVGAIDSTVNKLQLDDGSMIQADQTDILNETSVPAFSALQWLKKEGGDAFWSLYYG